MASIRVRNCHSSSLSCIVLSFPLPAVCISASICILVGILAVHTNTAGRKHYKSDLYTYLYR